MSTPTTPSIDEAPSSGEPEAPRSSERDVPPDSGRDPQAKLRVAVYVVAKDAVQSLAGVLDRIPPAVGDRVDEIFVFDSGSTDDTYLVGMGYKAVTGRENLTVIRGERSPNGALTKRAIAHCRERGYDVLALLHADGKYAPESLEELIAPLERGEADAVVGNRFVDAAAARAGMPFVKYVAMRILGACQRAVSDVDVEDVHCGYRAYSIPALAELPLELDTDELHFDTELLLQLGLAGRRVIEVPVPVYTGEESDGWAGLRYATGVAATLVEYWLHQSGVREVPKYAIEEKYAFKTAPNASHATLLRLVDRDNQRVLDLGCGAGFLAEALAARGHAVTGVDERAVSGVEGRVRRFVQLDLDRDVPDAAKVGKDFDWIVLADVLEHLRAPDRLLEACRELLAPGGALVVSVPNVAHWSVRLPLLFGRFRYTARGILDASHLRFYTRSTIEEALEAAGYTVERREVTNAPIEEVVGSGATGRFLSWVARGLARFWPGLFAFQIVVRARPGSALDRNAG